MRKPVVGSILAAGIALFLMSGTASKAEMSIDEIRAALQESLTITEIDRELERLADEESKLGETIARTEREIRQQDDKVKQARVHAGKVLRAYYTGDRDRVWMLLFHANSFSDALTVYQYLQSIAEADQHAMKRFLETYRELKQLREDLETRKRELAGLREEYLNQRQRVLQLQLELDRMLAAAADKDALLDEIARLNEAWLKEGLPLFREFLQAMSDAMQHLPEYLKENPDAIEQAGRRTIRFHIEESALNAFLRKRNPLFEQFVYTIDERHISIAGRRADTAIGVKGRYNIEKEPEEALRFMLDELTYNDFILPDTTTADMQQQFSMTFYPSQNEMTALLEVTEVIMQDGRFTIEFVIR